MYGGGERSVTVLLVGCFVVVQGKKNLKMKDPF